MVLSHLENEKKRSPVVEKHMRMLSIETTPN